MLNKTNNYKKILIFILILLVFKFNNVNAVTEITSFSQFANEEDSKKCSGKRFCATDIVAGVRITLIDDSGNKISGSQTINLWSNSTYASVANNNANTAGLRSYSGRTNSKMIDLSCTSYYADSEACNTSVRNVFITDPSLNFGTQNAGMYDEFIRSINSSNIAKILNKVKGSATINTSDHYLRLEPVYIISETYDYNKDKENDEYNSFFVGTSLEIIDGWGELLWAPFYGNANTAGKNIGKNHKLRDEDNENTHSIGYYFVCGGCNCGSRDAKGNLDGSIAGYWNVIRNYIVSMYLSCDNKPGGLNVKCYKGRNLSEYKANPAPKNSDGVYTRKGTHSMYCDSNNISNLISLYRNDNGLGRGYIKISEYLSEGTLEIKKYNEDSELITSSSASFNLYNGINCNENQKIIELTTSGGRVEYKLEAGNYSIKETDEPFGYIKDSTCHKIKINASETTEVKITNNKTCSTKLLGVMADLNFNNISQYLELYKEYPQYNGLLNFVSPSCQKVSCQKKQVETSCLSANNVTLDGYLFSKYNLSCYDNAITDPVTGEYKTFCKDKFIIINNLGYDKFYSKAGKFLIKEEGNVFGMKTLKFNTNYGVSTSVLTPFVATSIVDRTCYTIDSSFNINKSDIPSLELYFGDNDNNGYADKLNITNFNSLVSDDLVNTSTLKSLLDSSLTKVYNKIIEDVKSTTSDFFDTLDTNISKITNNPFIEKEERNYYGYNLNSFYIQKYTGKISFDSNEFNSSKIGKGIITGFNKSDSNGYIPFKIKYRNEYVSYDCKYVTEPEIIQYDIRDKMNRGELQLEFRAVDSKEPFARETNSNWCDSLGNCNETNLKTLLYIKLRTNSYGMNPCGQKQKPLYTITLTSSDIQKIKNYNETNSYDNYSNPLYCDQEGNCMNSFLHQLTEKTLEGEENLMNALTINENDHTVCDVKQKLEDELNKLDSAVRSKIKEELSELEKLGNIFE